MWAQFPHWKPLFLPGFPVFINGMAPFSTMYPSSALQVDLDSQHLLANWFYPLNIGHPRFTIIPYFVASELLNYWKYLVLNIPLVIFPSCPPYFLRHNSCAILLRKVQWPCNIHSLKATSLKWHMRYLIIYSNLYLPLYTLFFYHIKLEHSMLSIFIPLHRLFHQSPTPNSKPILLLILCSL